MNANMKSMQEKADADRKANREDLKEMMEEMMNVTLKEMSEEIRSGQAEMRSTISAIKEKLETAFHSASLSVLVYI
jgi:hypothetical protein